VPFDFYLYLASRFFSASAGTLLRAALAWHVFELTHSPFHLGLIGIVQFVPQMVLLLVGGAVADSFDRRRVINASQLVLVAMGTALFMLTSDHALTLPVLYALAGVQAAALSFEQPSRDEATPRKAAGRRSDGSRTAASLHRGETKRYRGTASIGCRLRTGRNGRRVRPLGVRELVLLSPRTRTIAADVPLPCGRFEQRVPRRPPRLAAVDAPLDGCGCGKIRFVHRRQARRSA
jgi:hypothetical protein